MKLSMQSVLGWVSRRAKHWHLVHPTPVAVAQCPSLLTQYPSAGSRVLCQEDTRVALVKNAYYLAEKR